MTRIVLLNAPPRAGKNTAAAGASAVLQGVAVIGFSHHLKRSVHAAFGLGWDLDPDHFDAVKSHPSEQFFGMTPRQAYIWWSEEVIKPKFGKEWFGEMFMRAARSACADTIIAPDSGFTEEAERVAKEVGPHNVMLIRLHKTGCTFDGDSRSYIDLDHLRVPTLDLKNIEGKPQLLVAHVVQAIRDWSA